MQMDAMTDGEPEAVAGMPKPKRPAEQAFDAWLERGLHEMFDQVAREPIPEELLKLIRDHKGK